MGSPNISVTGTPRAVSAEGGGGTDGGSATTSQEGAGAIAFRVTAALLNFQNSPLPSRKGPLRKTFTVASPVSSYTGLNVRKSFLTPPTFGTATSAGSSSFSSSGGSYTGFNLQKSFGLPSPLGAGSVAISDVGTPHCCCEPCEQW
jgi:hypothetical protein